MKKFLDACRRLLSIALNSTAKWKARVLPSVTDYVRRTGTLPRRLTFSFAAYVAFYHNASQRGEGCLIGRRGEDTYEVRDDAWVLDFYDRHRGGSAREIIHAVVNEPRMWDGALAELPGFEEDVPGKEVLTGFGRETLLGAAPAVLDAVAQGKLRHIFLVGGCDGTRPSRRYYTEFARLTPPDTILLTLACGKFRLNDLPLGTVPGTGLPRILDVGQCNDAYSAIRIALALADAFGCGVNDLPLSLVLCWFEQKAVCILIALLALGIRNIRLGPTLPPFLSPGVVRTLQERYGLKPIATPEADLQAILGG